MSKTVVVYATKTGHSRRLALAIAEAVGAQAVDVLKEEAPVQADLMFLAGGIYGGQSHPELVAYAKRLRKDSVKKVVLITSSVSVTSRKQSQIRMVLTQAGIDILDEITCPGGFLFVKIGHPDTADIKQAAKRARQILDELDKEDLQ